MPVWLTPDEHRTLSAACERLIPTEQAVGAGTAGAADYIDGLLGAFCFDPPRIWAERSPSGAAGAGSDLPRFHRLNALDELAWRTRIEGSLGLAEREINGRVVGLQERYRAGLGSLGSDFCDCDVDEQDRRLRADRVFTRLVYEHTCEGVYGAPEYGGNRGGVGWSSIGFAGPVENRGWTDEEVSGP